MGIQREVAWHLFSAIHTFPSPGQVGVSNMQLGGQGPPEETEDRFSMPLIITIVCMASFLLLVAALYGCCHQRFSQRKDQVSTPAPSLGLSPHCSRGGVSEWAWDPGKHRPSRKWTLSWTVKVAEHGASESERLGLSPHFVSLVCVTLSKSYSLSTRFLICIMGRRSTLPSCSEVSLKSWV